MYTTSYICKTSRGIDLSLASLDFGWLVGSEYVVTLNDVCRLMEVLKEPGEKTLC